MNIQVQNPHAAGLAEGFAAAPDMPDVLPPVKVRRGIWGAAWRHPAIAIGGVLLGCVILMAILAPLLFTVDPTAIEIGRAHV